MKRLETLKDRGELDWEEYENLGYDGVISEEVNPVYLNLEDSLSTIKTSLFFVKSLSNAKKNRVILTKKISDISTNLRSLEQT